MVLTLIFEIVTFVSAVFYVRVFFFRFVLDCDLTSLFCFLTNIFILFSLSLFLKLPFVFNTVELLFNLGWSPFDEFVVNHISTADSLLNFNKAKFHSRTKLV